MNVTPAGAPQVDVKSFGARLALAVARVRVDPDAHRAIAAAWLCGAEHARSARFAVDHARADFLAGRIAAKTAVHALAPRLAPPFAWEVRPGENQQPLIAHALAEHGLSLAHSGGVGLAMAHDVRERHGVDLELIVRDADEAIATQVTAAEAAWARAGGAHERVRWLLLWTAREAQGKSHGTGLLDPDHLSPTEQWEPAAHGWRARISSDKASIVRSVIAGGFVASLVLPESADVEAIARWVASVLTR